MFRFFLNYLYVYSCECVYFCSVGSYKRLIKGKISQGFHKSEKPGIVGEFCKPGKVSKFEIWSGKFFMTSFLQFAD